METRAGELFGEQVEDYELYDAMRMRLVIKKIELSATRAKEKNEWLEKAKCGHLTYRKITESNVRRYAIKK